MWLVTLFVAACLGWHHDAQRIIVPSFLARCAPGQPAPGPPAGDVAPVRRVAWSASGARAPHVTMELCAHGGLYLDDRGAHATFLLAPEVTARALAVVAVPAVLRGLRAARCPGVADASIVVEVDAGDERIRAVVTGCSDGTGDAVHGALRLALDAALPGYDPLRVPAP